MSKGCIIFYPPSSPSTSRLCVYIEASLCGTFLQTLSELEGHVHFISAQLSTAAVSALRKDWVLKRQWQKHWVEARTINIK